MSFDTISLVDWDCSRYHKDSLIIYMDSLVINSKPSDFCISSFYITPNCGLASDCTYKHDNNCLTEKDKVFFSKTKYYKGHYIDDVKIAIIRDSIIIRKYAGTDIKFEIVD